MNEILDQKLKNQRIQINHIVGELHGLTQEIGHHELQQTIQDLKERINEPFMFVIVGEVKAGKSSFINALLDAGKEICKVAPSPMTDTIQQIVYGAEESFTDISPFLKRITQPVEILKEIAIVDTPGTNTIVDHHQEITEKFIPASDLIVFVFEAKNPYRQSAWDFFNYIHDDWRKKIVFVLQQKDLMNEEDLAINTEGVKKYAKDKGIESPLVFAVSAKQEIEGEKEISGFKNIRAYIMEHITGGKAPLLKLQSNVQTAQNLNDRISQGMLIRKQQWDADTFFRKDVQQTLDDQEKKSQYQVNTLIENLLAAYDRITLKTERELSEGLNFFTLLKRSFSSFFSKKESAQEWLGDIAKNLERDLNAAMKDRLNSGVVDIADSIQQMAHMIDLKIRNSKTILKENHDLFSEIAEKRTHVIQDLQEAFTRFMNRSENFTDEELFPGHKSMSPNVATGSGIAVIGVILATVTNGMVFDITGGILTTIGLLFAGVSVGIQRKKVINGYRVEIEKGRQQLEGEVTTKLNQYIRNIKDKIDGNFDEFDTLLKEEETQITQIEGKQKDIENRLKDLENALSV
ncbi:MAG: GTPase SAR1 family protein [Polaribacter sp.]|jgi:GTPase SAR1 family protein